MAVPYFVFAMYCIWNPLKGLNQVTRYKGLDCNSKALDRLYVWFWVTYLYSCCQQGKILIRPSHLAASWWAAGGQSSIMMLSFLSSLPDLLCTGLCGRERATGWRKSLFNEQYNGDWVIRAVQNLETGLLSVICTLVRHCYGDVYSKTVVPQKTLRA